MATQAKAELRSQMKQRLSPIPEQGIASQSQAAQNTILSLPQYRQANRIGIYLSMPEAEARTDILVRDALESGKKVFVPCVYAVRKAEPKRKAMEMLRLESVEEYLGLQRDVWGIPKLRIEGREGKENAMGGKGLTFDDDADATAQADAGGLDVIVVPAVAFDADLNRLGHGAGFYDRFLSRFCAGGKRKKPFLVGLCLTEQILPAGQLVMQEWDWRVDAVAVGDGRLISGDTQ